MSRAALTLILLLQCGLIALLYWPDSMLAQQREQSSLTAFNPDYVDEIHIDDGKNNEAILLRVDGQWLLPELDELPADRKLVQALLSAINLEPQGRPVADSIPARQRFQVATYHYLRRMTIISEGELLATVYLGTSPGFRKIHARNADSDSIYSIGFNVFDAPAFASGWLQRSLLQSNDVTAIQGPDYALRLEPQGWQASNGVAPDFREMEALLLALASLQTDGIAADDDQRTLSEAAPDLALTIATPGGDQRLEFFTLEGQHFVYSSKYPLFFTISDYDFDRITGIDGALLRAEFSDPGPDRSGDG